MVLFVKGIPHRLSVTATSGTAAGKTNGDTVHSACNLPKGAYRVSSGKGVDGFNPSGSAGLRVDGQARMDLQEKHTLIMDEVSMLGAWTLCIVNERNRGQVRVLKEAVMAR